MKDTKEIKEVNNVQTELSIESVEKAAEELIEELELEEPIVRPYELRKLKDGDLFPLLKIFRKIGLQNFKDSLTRITSGESVEDVGILVLLDMAEMIIGNLDKAEEDIYSFYADISDISPDEIKEMEFGTLPLMIYDSFSGVKNTAFFKVLSKLL